VKIVKIIRALVVVQLTLAMSACVSLGFDFNEAQVKSLQNNVTTQTQVKEMLGNPWRTGMENGLVTWTYGRYQYGLFKPALAKDLVLRFDNSGMLKSYTYSSTQ